MSYKILYLSRNYPNNIVGLLGLWVEGLVSAMSSIHDVRVVAPVPYCPPLPKFISYARNRKIFKRGSKNGIDVYCPRYLSPPGYWMHSFVGLLTYWSIVRKIDRYRKEFPFDLIHAHFTYPDGYVAARLAKRYNVPFVITEHAAWIPWMDDYPKVKQQAVWAAKQSAAVIAGSHYLADTISHFTAQTEKINVIPIGVNTACFRPSKETGQKKAGQILYVGRIHTTKGVDVLFRAISLLAKKHNNIRLVIIGGNLGFNNYQIQENNMRQLADELEINPYLEFAGMQPPENVVRIMQQSAMLVLPSRRETFGTALIEAIACGTPVVATKCGGPEDFVTEDVGVLVEKEDPQSLANGIEKVLLQPQAYSADRLHQYAGSGFSWQYVAEQTDKIYRQALQGRLG